MVPSEHYPAAGPGGGGVPVPAAQLALHDVRRELRTFYHERDEFIDVALTALVARLDCLALGDAGVAKTSIIESLMSHIEGARLFSTQLHRLMMPDGLFGPISVKGLSEDSYRHVTAGRLPEAHVAFLSEMSEGSAHILNSLRVLLSQRQFESDGQFHPVPLVCCFFDSNRLPDPEDGLSPLVDRLVLRTVVPDLSDGVFAAFLAAALAKPVYMPSTRISLEHLYALHHACDVVTVPPALLDTLVSLRGECREAGITASPRRWKQSLRALQATALLDGRSEVSEDDLSVYGHILWNTAEERQAVLGMTARRANPVVAEALALADSVVKLAAEGTAAARSIQGVSEGDKVTAGEQLVAKASLAIRQAKKRLFSLVEQARREGRGEAKVAEQMKRADEAHKAFGRETGMLL